MGFFNTLYAILTEKDMYSEALNIIQPSAKFFLNLLVTHFVADFCFQTEKDAINKSKSFKHLLNHTFSYVGFYLISFAVVAICALIDKEPIHAVTYLQIVFFLFLKLIFHTIIDYFTSKKIAKLFADKVYYTDIPNRGAFAWIGFDQLLHIYETYFAWVIAGFIALTFYVNFHIG